jgi:Lrp/AsnC family leucine-responsive transcriptional regulator
MAMDTIDAKILHELGRDGRVTNLQLASRVSLSPSACLRRVQALEATGAIKGYRAILDRTQLGGGMTVFVMVGLSGQLQRDSLAFERAMAAAPEVLECHNVTGSVEYLLRVEVSDLPAYKHFHSNVLGTLNQVSSITSLVSLGSSKDLRA